MSVARRPPTGRLAVAAAALALTACAGPPPLPSGVPAAVVPEASTPIPTLARFGDARALAADAAGRLYVVDAAASAVVVLDTTGRVLGQAGGAGTGAYALLGPADVDPTNGLEWFVADAGNGRVQRLSYDGRLLESVAVPRDPPRDGASERRPPGDDERAGEGRPVAVAVGPAGVLYAAEATRGVVLRWDEASRRRVAEVGGPTSGAGRLAEPVGLAVADDGALYVADRGRGEVVVFDAFGSVVRALPAPGVRAVGLVEGPGAPRVVVVAPRAVTLLRPDGSVEATRPLDGLGEEAVDAVAVGRALYVLTRTRLARLAE